METENNDVVTDTYQHEFYYCKEQDWYLHVNIQMNAAGEDINRQLMVFDKDGNVVHDPRLEDDVWQFNFDRLDYVVGNSALDGIVTILDDYKKKLLASGFLVQE